MCPGPKPTPITITVSATFADPFPPSISDGLNTAPPGGDRNFTTQVVPGQTIMFRTAGDIAAITAIPEGPGSDIFSTDPTKENNWTAVVGTLSPGDTREYSVSYTMKGNDTVRTVDPKLQMKK